jgi:hypothetical protein
LVLVVRQAATHANQTRLATTVLILFLVLQLQQVVAVAVRIGLAIQHTKLDDLVALAVVVLLVLPQQPALVALELLVKEMLEDRLMVAVHIGALVVAAKMRLVLMQQVPLLAMVVLVLTGNLLALLMPGGAVVLVMVLAALEQ